MGSTKYTVMDGSAAADLFAFFAGGELGFRGSQISKPARTAAGITNTRFATTDKESARAASTSLRGAPAVGLSRCCSTSASAHIQKPSAIPYPRAATMKR